MTTSCSAANFSVKEAATLRAAIRAANDESAAARRDCVRLQELAVIAAAQVPCHVQPLQLNPWLSKVL